MNTVVVVDENPLDLTADTRRDEGHVSVDIGVVGRDRAEGQPIRGIAKHASHDEKQEANRADQPPSPPCSAGQPEVAPPAIGARAQPDHLLPRGWPRSVTRLSPRARSSRQALASYGVFNPIFLRAAERRCILWDHRAVWRMQDQATARERRSHSSKPMRPSRASPSGTSERSSTRPPQYRASGSRTTSRGSPTAFK